MHRNRYLALDGLRGIASILVLVRHSGFLWGYSPFRSYLAVDIFFMLSGFVIASAYDRRLSDRALSTTGFLVLRLVRLYPMYLAGASIGICELIALYVLKNYDSHISLLNLISVILLTLFFLPSLLKGNPSIYPANGPCWSLLFEILGNLLFSLFHRWLTPRILLIVALICLSELSFRSWTAGTFDSGNIWSFASFLTGFARSIFGISVGVLLFRRKATWSTYVPRHISSWLAFAIATAVLVSPNTGHLNWLVDTVSLAVIFPACILAASHRQDLETSRWLPVLGSASYPLYVLHGPLLWPVEALSSKTLAIGVPLTGLSFALALVIISLLLEKNYDIPIRAYLSRLITANGKTEVPLRRDSKQAPR